MDQRKFQAWKEIVDRKDDPTAPPIIRMSRQDLSELINELEHHRGYLSLLLKVAEELQESLRSEVRAI